MPGWVCGTDVPDIYLDSAASNFSNRLTVSRVSKNDPMSTAIIQHIVPYHSAFGAQWVGDGMTLRCYWGDARGSAAIEETLAVVRSAETDGAHSPSRTSRRRAESWSIYLATTGDARFTQVAPSSVSKEFALPPWRHTRIMLLRDAWLGRSRAMELWFQRRPCTTAQSWGSWPACRQTKSRLVEIRFYYLLRQMHAITHLRRNHNITPLSESWKLTEHLQKPIGRCILNAKMKHSF